MGSIWLSGRTYLSLLNSPRRARFSNYQAGCHIVGVYIVSRARQKARSGFYSIFETGPEGPELKAKQPKLDLLHAKVAMEVMALAQNGTLLRTLRAQLNRRISARRARDYNEVSQAILKKIRSSPSNGVIPFACELLSEQSFILFFIMP